MIVRKTLRISFFGFVGAALLGFLAAAPAWAASREDARTVFEVARDSWAVGTIRLSGPLRFRQGALLVFPSAFSSVAWTSEKTKPRNVMLVHEVGEDEKEKPFLKEGDEVFAAVELLPYHAYWKDNLPTTRRHRLAGGRRAVFRGEDLAPARATFEAFFAASSLKGVERWKGEAAAVAHALTGPVAVLRADASRYLAALPSLARDLSPEAVADVRAYLAGPAPAAEKAPLVSAVGVAGVASMRADVEAYAARDDVLGAAGRRGMEGYGILPSTPDLLALAGGSSADLAAYAAQALGRRAATDPAAAARVRQLLAGPSTPPGVEAARGLAEAGGDASVALLTGALGRKDEVGLAAADALARIGSDQARASLAEALAKGRGATALAAARALGDMAARGCKACEADLAAQKESHADPEVRTEAARIVADLPKMRH